MNRPAGRMLSRPLTIAVVVSCSATFLAQDACILAQPSGELPRIPESRPTILHPLVVPSTTTVLTRYPTTLFVPVELADPTVEFAWALFIDYNPLTGDGLVGEVQHSRIEATNTVGRTRSLTIQIPNQPPAIPDRCQTIEVLVALRFQAESNGKSAHTPLDPGGDVVTWFYNPSSDFGRCPTLDAGIDASNDADAADGAAQ